MWKLKISTSFLRSKPLLSFKQGSDETSVLLQAPVLFRGLGMSVNPSNELVSLEVFSSSHAVGENSSSDAMVLVKPYAMMPTSYSLNPPPPSTL